MSHALTVAPTWRVVPKKLWIGRLVHALTVTLFRVVHALTVTLSRINGDATNKEPVFPCMKYPVVRASHPVDSLRLTHRPLAPATNVFKTKRTQMQTSIRAKAIVLALMLLVTGPALAEWVGVSETNDATIYIDPATIRKDGNFRKVWVLMDFKKRNELGRKSYRTRDEFDCNSERQRTLSFSAHSGPMAAGEVLETKSGPWKWRDAAPDTPRETVLKFVCGQ